MSKFKINNFKKIIKNRWFVFLSIGFLIFTILFLIIFVSFEIYYKDKIYPGVEINGIGLSGNTRSDGVVKLKSITSEIINNGLFFQYKGREVVVSPVIVSASDPGLSREIINLNIENNINKAFLLGRRGSFLQNLKEKFLILLNGASVSPGYFLDKEELRDILFSNFSSLEDPGRDAGVDISYKNNKFNVEIINEKLGRTFDYDLAIKMAEDNVRFFSSRPIEMYMKTDYPTTKIEEVRGFIPSIETVLGLSPVGFENKCFTEKYKSDKICTTSLRRVVSDNEFAGWISLRKDNSGLNISLNRDRIVNYLSGVSAEINIEPVDARFDIDDGRVIEFQESSDGISVNIEKTIFELEDKILNKSSSTLSLIIEDDIANNSIGDINDLGIRELLCVGKSDFSGSPDNRRHNISIGSEKLHGLIIEPDEEFSLIGELGDINKESGYLEELVIKGNRTVPEYGGGLCQIATTMFRSALECGLSITERRPHAYRVSYYEPAGTDATIYTPKPDFMFINDTGNHILIRTKIVKDELIFELWGTSDNRSVELSDPKISNVVEPGPTKIVETEDLKPGEKECTESSHNGVDAEFIRKIIRPSGDIEEERWWSRYRPWQAVCLVGKDPDSDTLNEDDLIDVE